MNNSPTDTPQDETPETFQLPGNILIKSNEDIKKDYKNKIIGLIRLSSELYFVKANPQKAVYRCLTTLEAVENMQLAQSLLIQSIFNFIITGTWKIESKDQASTKLFTSMIGNHDGIFKSWSGSMMYWIDDFLLQATQHGSQQIQTMRNIASDFINDLDQILIARGVLPKERIEYLAQLKSRWGLNIPQSPKA